MSKDAHTPRLYLLRHGPTSWSLSGRYTGVSDIPLLPSGETLIRQTAHVIFGPGKLIDPAKLARVFVSPRQRARRTWQLCVESLGVDSEVELEHSFGHEHSELSPGKERGEGGKDVRREFLEKVQIREEVREWEYGDYEGLLTSEIRALRGERGYDPDSGRAWDIWRDGTEGEGSEGPEDVKRRVDAVIAEVVKVQGGYMRRMKGEQKSEQEQKQKQNGAEGQQDRQHDKINENQGCDILIIAHGHILRALVKRWLGLEMASPVELMLEPGGVCGLSYAHGNVEERAVLVGMSFPQPLGNATGTGPGSGSGS